MRLGVGVSFFEMLQNKKPVGAALSEGWNLVKNNFWRSVGVNFVMGLLLFILLMLMMTVPGVLFGIYTFHVVENSVSLTSNVVATVIYTICLLSVNKIERMPIDPTKSQISTKRSIHLTK